MKKLTLRFPSFEDLSAFVKQLNSGYLINTNTLTITAKFLDSQVCFASKFFHAELIETSESVYSYDPF